MVKTQCCDAASNWLSVEGAHVVVGEERYSVHARVVVGEERYSVHARVVVGEERYSVHARVGLDELS